MNKAKKFVGPSKRMAQALEAEGLNVEWPKVIRSDEDLAIEATYYTGANDYQKNVLIDLRDKLGIDTKQGVDNCIAYELQAAWENYDVDGEMKLYLGVDGAPEAAELLEDLKEADGCLKRFADVADAVASGRPIPEKVESAEITISGSDARRIRDILDEVGHGGFLDEGEKEVARQLRKELADKIKEAMR